MGEEAAHRGALTLARSREDVVAERALLTSRRHIVARAVAKRAAAAASCDVAPAASKQARAPRVTAASRSAKRKSGHER